MNWQAFKSKEFAVRCEHRKDEFFSDCRKNGILVLMGEREKLRSIFVCVQRYDDRLSNGRYELYTLELWQTLPGSLYGKFGLPIFDFDQSIDT